MTKASRKSKNSIRFMLGLVDEIEYLETMMEYERGSTSDVEAVEKRADKQRKIVGHLFGGSKKRKHRRR